MKYVLLTITVTLMASPALAGIPTSVPEMDAGAGVAAVALLVGIAAIIREKRKK